MLVVNQLMKAFGDLRALRGVSFEVNEGEILGLLGPNGAGKTTTMRIVTGYLPADSGSVLVDGLDVLTQSLAVRQRLGYLPEHTPLYKDMRIAEFLDFRAHIKGVPRRERRQRVAEVMEKTQISERSRQVINNLSKGYRQRVGLADALIGRPHLLILDEPTIGLDPNQVKQVRGLIKELASDHTVVLSTHILAEVEMICNRVVIINQGLTVASDTIESLIDQHNDHAILLVFSKQHLDSAKVLEELGKLEAVLEATLVTEDNDKLLKMRVLPKNEGDLRPALFDWARQTQYPLLEIHRERVSLEDVFSKLTLTEQAQPETAKEARTKTSEEPKPEASEQSKESEEEAQ